MEEEELDIGVMVGYNLIRMSGRGSDWVDWGVKGADPLFHLGISVLVDDFFCCDKIWAFLVSCPVTCGVAVDALYLEVARAFSFCCASCFVTFVLS